MPPVTNDTAVHYVYRAYDAQNRCLYIGCSKDADARIAHHRRYGSPWIFDVVRFKVTVHPGRTAGLAAETEAIGAEQPVWNVQGRFKTHDTWTQAEWHEYVANRIAIAQPFTRGVATHLINAENLYRLQFGHWYPAEIAQLVADHIGQFQQHFMQIPERYRDLLPSSKASA